MGLVIAFNGLYLTKESEEDDIEGERSMNSSLISANRASEGRDGFWYKLNKNLG